MNFTERFNQVLSQKKSLLCIGLDTVLERLPEPVRRMPEPLIAFNRIVVEATADLAAAYKVNTAFYEALGAEGWRALEATFKLLPGDTIKIADAKRGDIGNTSAMYARALFDILGADAVTVNPYLGRDGLEPFLRQENKGVFVLCLTSNPGARDFQYANVDGAPLYERVASAIHSWNEHRNCGLVAGATRAEQLERVRQLAGDMPLLIPGIGAQGGDLEKAVRFGLTRKGGGALFNSSRAILYASSGSDYADAIRGAAQETRDALNRARSRADNP